MHLLFKYCGQTNSIYYSNILNCSQICWRFFIFTFAFNHNQHHLKYLSFLLHNIYTIPFIIHKTFEVPDFSQVLFYRKLILNTTFSQHNLHTNDVSSLFIGLVAFEFLLFFMLCLLRRRIVFFGFPQRFYR